MVDENSLSGNDQQFILGNIDNKTEKDVDQNQDNQLDIVIPSDEEESLESKYT